jgi:hypothetical protein
MKALPNLPARLSFMSFQPPNLAQIFNASIKRQSIPGFQDTLRFPHEQLVVLVWLSCEDPF